MAEGTVRNYLSSAITKLHARNRTEAATPDVGPPPMYRPKGSCLLCAPDARNESAGVTTMNDEATSWLQVTTCPECSLPAEITSRHVLASTDGPIEHARVQCVDRHVFNLPVAMLAVADEPSNGADARTPDTTQLRAA